MPVLLVRITALACFLFSADAVANQRDQAIGGGCVF